MVIPRRNGSLLHGIPAYLPGRELPGRGDFHQSLQHGSHGPTVRLLVRTMDAENMHYPLHLGVTEAGDGEDGRIKSAVGIGTLLTDGIGDTIRVSLSEDPEAEIPVARKLVDYILERREHRPIVAYPAPGYDPVTATRRISRVTEGIGGNFPPCRYLRPQ